MKQPRNCVLCGCPTRATIDYTLTSAQRRLIGWPAKDLDLPVCILHRRTKRVAEQALNVAHTMLQIAREENANDQNRT